MNTIDVRPQGHFTLPTSEPRRSLQTGSDPFPHHGVATRGTAELVTGDPGLVGLWLNRQDQWHSGFQQKIGPRLSKYWAIWRAFNQGPNPGPGQEWRDRTVIPQAFKELDTLVPKIILGMWADPRAYSVRGRGFMDAKYEEMVRTLLDQLLDEIGVSDPMGELFLKRMIDAEYYKQIIGHVWYKVTWRTEQAWLKTKLPKLNEKGEITGWDPVEMLETISDGIDISWLPVTRLAIDLYGRRRWAIERVMTSLESLKEENNIFREQHKVPLYRDEALAQLEMQKASVGASKERQEPRDTEHWPLDGDGLYSLDPGEQRVELLLCWDNVRRTLTKLGNRHVVLAHGLADTPDGRDPYVGGPAIPIPGSPYGDSLFNWTGPLYTRQTRIARARMDETMMNLFSQYFVREGALKGTTWFWRPGGVTPVQQANPDRPISDNIFLVPRRPLPPEGFSEEAYTQQQSEAVTGADSISQGVEATQKSRDVSASETNQRVTQGAVRIRVRNLYYKATVLKPMLAKVFDLARKNLTQPKLLRRLDDFEGERVDLTNLIHPIDIMIADPIEEITEAETMAELEKLATIAQDQNFALNMKHREVLEDIVKNMRTLRRSPSRYVRTEEEVKQIQQQQAAAAAAQTATGGGGEVGKTSPDQPAGAAPPPPAAGQDTGASLAGPNGGGQAIPPQQVLAEI